MLMLALFQAETREEPLLDGREIVLHQLKGHGRENQTEEKVERTEQRFATLVIGQCTFAGYEIAQADGREGNEREVSTVDERPSLPAREENSTGHDVQRKDTEGRGNGHVFNRLLLDLQGECREECID